MDLVVSLMPRRVIYLPPECPSSGFSAWVTKSRNRERGFSKFCITLTYILEVTTQYDLCLK
jgi:hypothetical protein